MLTIRMGTLRVQIVTSVCAAYICACACVCMHECVHAYVSVCVRMCPRMCMRERKPRAETFMRTAKNTKMGLAGINRVLTGKVLTWIEKTRLI